MFITFLMVIADVVFDPDSSSSYEKIGLVGVLLLIGYLFMTKRIVVGAFYTDALDTCKSLEEEVVEQRKVNHDLRNVNNAAMLQIAELTFQLTSARSEKIVKDQQ